jgi:hypothetical protein
MYVCIMYKLYTYIEFADAREIEFGCDLQLKQINSAIPDFKKYNNRSLRYTVNQVRLTN